MELIFRGRLPISYLLSLSRFSGGDSKNLLNKYRERIAAGFEPGELDRCLEKIARTIDGNPEVAAGAVVRLIKTAKIGRCLVLMPYDKVHNRLYKSRIGPAIARHMIPLRLDRLPTSEAIYPSFAAAMQTSSAVIVDITKLNVNVMYEIGYSHARGLKPLIYTRNKNRLLKLPIYLRTLNVRAASATTVAALIEEYLCSLKRSRRLSISQPMP